MQGLFSLGRIVCFFAFSSGVISMILLAIALHVFFSASFRAFHPLPGRASVDNRLLRTDD